MTGPTDWPRLQKAVEEYQDPAKADKIAAIHKELEETTAVLVSPTGIASLFSANR